MTSVVTELAVDCADPGSLARFWCSVLDYEVHDDAGNVVSIGPRRTAEPTRAGPPAPRLTFARVPEPKVVKNRLHLDVNPIDQEQGAEVRRLLELGARRADVGQDDQPENDQRWVVLTDPEGNEFCVLASRRPG